MHCTRRMIHLPNEATVASRSSAELWKNRTSFKANVHCWLGTAFIRGPQIIPRGTTKSTFEVAHNLVDIQTLQG